jgi:N-acetylglucosamine kinase-like BadF-type ATPase
VRRRFATAPHAVRAVAALAPRVVARARRGQRPAARIVADAQAHLATQAAAVARALRLPAPIVMGGAGSVMDDRWFAAGVRQALARAGVRAHWREPGGEPVDAAVRLAASLAARPR